ncbi:MAG: hypothetical protein IKK42_02980 [Oscillospiraceae bacterium]|nr:hypothetical protein [Oscillospiraceae bacterium]
MSNRFFYTPKERPARLLRISSLLFAAGTIALWLFGEKLGLEKGDLLIMSGIAVLLLTCSINGRRAEKLAKVQEKEFLEMREECGKGDYNNDIFYDK